MSNLGVTSYSYAIVSIASYYYTPPSFLPMHIEVRPYLFSLVDQNNCEVEVYFFHIAFNDMILYSTVS